MKTYLCALSMLCLPIFLLAQPDWCTCMEEENQYTAATSYVSQVSSPQILISSESSSLSLFQDEHISKNKVEVAKEEPIPEVVKEDVVEEKEMLEKVERVPLSKAQIRKKSYHQKGKRKRKNRFKKYKGGCPVF